jgi:hypothetical protein
MPAGRPPKYNTPEEMQEVIDKYFDENDIYTVSGLAYELDMSTEALRNYEAKDEFLATVKKAKQRVEISLEKRLASNAVAGSIFNLKNNFGWKDKTEVEQSGNFSVSFDTKDAETL